MVAWLPTLPPALSLPRKVVTSSTEGSCRISEAARSARSAIRVGEMLESARISPCSMPMSSGGMKLKPYSFTTRVAMAKVSVSRMIGCQRIRRRWRKAQSSARS